MKEYYELNKAKVRFLIKLYLLAFGVLSMASVGVVVYFFDFDPVKGILFGLAATVALTAFLVLQALVTGNYEYQRRKRIFGIPVFRSFFQENNFAWIPTLTDSKWDLTEKIMTGRIYGFVVEADIDEDNPQFILFKFKTERISLNKEKFNQLIQILKSYNANLAADGVVFNLEFVRIKTEEELNFRLASFAEMMLKEGFTPN